MTTKKKDKAAAGDEWLTARQAAHIIQCSEMTIYGLIREKKLRAAKVTGSRDIRIHRTWINEWLNQTATIPLKDLAEAANQ